MNSQDRKSIVEKCIDALKQDFTVVVETERLRHLIVDGYNIRMMESGGGSWPTPEASTWNQWMRNLWQSIEQTAPSAVNELLSGNQTTALWEQVIARSIRSNRQDEFEYLLWHVTSTANQAKAAYQLISKYCIDDSEFDRELSEDSRMFLDWLKDYRAQLRRNGYIDSEFLPEEIVRHLSKEHKRETGKVIFAGFDEWPPQNEYLIGSLQRLGWDIRVLSHDPEKISTKVVRREFETVDEEIEQCACWARSIIEQNSQEHYVGVVVPSITEQHTKIRRTFSAILNPSAVLDQRQDNKMSYHITLGTELSQTPIVVDAMNLLELIKSQVEVPVMCSVIQSDRLKGWDEESALRSNFARELFTLRVDITSIDDTLAIMASRFLKGSELYRTLHVARERLSQTPQTADFGYWAKFITDWLRLFQANSREGRSFSDIEWRAHAQWGKLVEGLAELGFLSRKVRIEEVIAQLRRITQNSNFQSRALRVPIQVGGMVALLGQRFTHLWIMGMNKDAIPGASRPNQFIPVPVQKKYCISQATPQLAYEQCEKRLHRLVNSADITVMSYARSDLDAEYEPSLMLEKYSNNSLQDISITNYITYTNKIVSQDDELEEFTESNAGMVSDSELRVVGTGLFRDQSQCPFKAFAHYRLKAENPRVPSIGVGPLEHGSLVHSLLEYLFRKYTRKEVLERVEDDNFRAELVNLSRTYLGDMCRIHMLSVNEEAFENGVDRSVDTVIDWVQNNEIKLSMHEVYATEIKLESEINGLPIRIHIDRVDRLYHDDPLDFEYVVIDYKTGYCNVNDLKGYRPSEPQLLVYGCAVEMELMTPVGHVAFAGLKKGSKGFDCVLFDELDLEQDPEELCNRLADEFLKGCARVDPIRRACDYCDLSSLCRIC